MKKIINFVISFLPFDIAKACILKYGKLEYTWCEDEVLYYRRLGDWCASPSDEPLFRNAGLVNWYLETKAKVRRALLDIEQLG